VADDDHTRIAGWAESAGRAAAALTLPGLDHDLLWHPSREASFAGRGRGRVDASAPEALVSWMRGTLGALYSEEPAGG
jgi:hypothetical protein